VSVCEACVQLLAQHVSQLGPPGGQDNRRTYFSIKSECLYMKQFRNVMAVGPALLAGTSCVFLPDLLSFITSVFLLKFALHPLFVLFYLLCYYFPFLRLSTTLFCTFFPCTRYITHSAITISILLFLQILADLFLLLFCFTVQGVTNLTVLVHGTECYKYYSRYRIKRMRQLRHMASMGEEKCIQSFGGNVEWGRGALEDLDLDGGWY